MGDIEINITEIENNFDVLDVINEERVIVHWKENEGEDAVYLIEK